MSAATLLPGLRPAGLARRLLAGCVDAVVPGLAVAALAVGALGVTDASLVLVVVAVVVLLAWGVATAVLVARGGASLGMRAVGIALLGVGDARPIGWRRYLARERSRLALLATLPGALSLLDGAQNNPDARTYADQRGDAAVVETASVRAARTRLGSAIDRHRHATALAVAADGDFVAAPQRFSDWGPIEHVPSAPAQEIRREFATPAPAPISSVPGPVAPRQPPAAPTRVAFGSTARSAASASRPEPSSVASAGTVEFRPTVPERDQAVTTQARRPQPTAEPEPSLRLTFRPAVATPDEPAWQLVFDDGRVVAVEGLILVGRQPETSGEHAQLISIGADRRRVSKTHLAVAPVGDALVVVDRGSTNGTALDRGPRGMTACRPGREVGLREGSVVVFGDHSFTVRRARA